MMESGFYPPGAEHDPRAPWNADEPDEDPMPTLDEIDEDDPAWDGTVHAFCGRPTVYCDCE